MFLIAQAAVDPISGGAGWVGAGLLGMVLGWLLLFHLPAKDKYIKDLVDGKDVQMDKVLEDNRTALKEVGQEFRISLKEITDHCSNELKFLTDFWKRELDILQNRSKP